MTGDWSSGARGAAGPKKEKPKDPLRAPNLGCPAALLGRGARAGGGRAGGPAGRKMEKYYYSDV